MSETRQPHVKRALVIRLPGTGKSTFMAALWHVLEFEVIASALRLAKLSDERQYLNRIRADWRRCNAVERTQIGSEESIVLPLLASDSGLAVDLIVPDMSGESFQASLRDRRWFSEFDSFVMQADGVLLFIHPSRVREPIPIDQWMDTTDALEVEDEEQIEGDFGTGVPWSHEQVPTQVELVDLLQIMLSRILSAGPLKVAVMLSAWDLVLNLGLSPAEWLRKRLPLLDQYLHSNDDVLDVRIYGLSAQGGDITNVHERVRLLREDHPAERVMIIGPQAGAHDITAPIRWLIEE
jgi:hypothetical protein